MSSGYSSDICACITHRQEQYPNGIETSLL